MASVPTAEAHSSTHPSVALRLDHRSPKVWKTRANMKTPGRFVLLLSGALLFFISATGIRNQAAFRALADDSPANRPWMDKALSPDQRAALVLKEMTLEEKL